MAQTVKIQPDIQFIRELREAGGDSLKACYQCATCSVACPISPQSNPYPRKEMVWAQWGLKDRLLSDPDVWLCYNCGGCSDLCPRGAKPGDLMAALRNMAYKRLVKPSIIGEWMSSPKYLPILIAIPMVIFAIFWMIMASVNFHGNFAGGMFPTGQIVYGKIFYGDYIIDPFFMATLGFTLFTFYRGVKKLIAEIGPKGATTILGPKKAWYICLLEVLFGEIMTHSKFTECGDDSEKNSRKIGHMSLFYAFVALAIVTGCVATGHWIGRIPFLSMLYLDTPLPMWHPLKILANVGLVLMLVGLSYLTIRRVGLDPKKQKSNYYDWYLIGVIWFVGLTGMFSQFFRLADWVAPAYIVYYFHLVSVFMLFAYLPWSKLGHLVYRTAALTYVRYIGR
jgi:Heterodisulfide reductase, subunit C